MKRKILSACLAGALMLTSVPALAGENTGEMPLPFNDVASADWYYDSVRYAYGQGLMTGTSDTTFEPNTTTTRGMIVSVLYRLEGNPEMPDGNWGYPYEDVLAGEWYSTPVYWARMNGIVRGYSDSKFGPNDAITREQLAAILYNYAKYKGQDVSATTDLSKYSDAAKVSDWATDVLSWANAKGLINGMTENTIDPQASATRAQVAAIMQRFLGDAETPEPQGKTVNLVIGQPDNLKTVTATVDEVTPENLLVALAKETDWNLDLASAVTTRDVAGKTVANIAFAKDSGLYTEPPQNQKDAYHVYDREDWIYTLLNSVSETFRANGYDGVSFTAPDGGKLVLDNNFYLMPNFVWNYDAAYASNHQDEKTFDNFYTSPDTNAINPVGIDALAIYLPVSGADIADGTMTVYNEAGEAIKTVQLKDVASVNKTLDQEYLENFSTYYNWDKLTIVNLHLDRSLWTAGKYSIHLDGNSIKGNDGRLLPEITREQWKFEVGGFGIGDSTFPNVEPSKLELGKKYTVDVILDGEHADRAFIYPENGLISSDITTFTKSGTATFTPEKSTNGKDTLLWQVDFYKGDTFVYSIVYTGSIG